MNAIPTQCEYSISTSICLPPRFKTRKTVDYMNSEKCVWSGGEGIERGCKSHLFECHVLYGWLICMNRYRKM